MRKNKKNSKKKIIYIKKIRKSKKSAGLNRKGYLKENLVGKIALPFEELKLNESVSIRKISQSVLESD